MTYPEVRDVDEVAIEDAPTDNPDEFDSQVDSPLADSPPADPPCTEVYDPPSSAPATGVLARAGLGLIGFYQRAISPLTPPSCRFRPTCSQYTRIAIERYGFYRGAWLGLRRLMRCHPFHPGGHDPVP